MTGRRRPRDVIVAEYSYRHEAEFAAGFLEDAGIPYRVEADDAGGIDGWMTLVRPARVWVRAEDAERARELLEVTPRALTEPQPGEEADASDAGSEEADALAAVEPPPVPSPPSAPDAARLCGAERAVALTVGGGLAALAVASLRGAGPGGGSLWGVISGLVGVIFLWAGVRGRARGIVRDVLRALSGVAP